MLRFGPRVGIVRFNDHTDLRFHLDEPHLFITSKLKTVFTGWLFGLSAKEYCAMRAKVRSVVIPLTWKMGRPDVGIFFRDIEMANQSGFCGVLPMKARFNNINFQLQNVQGEWVSVVEINFYVFNYRDPISIVSALSIELWMGLCYPPKVVKTIRSEGIRAAIGEELQS